MKKLFWILSLSLLLNINANANNPEDLLEKNVAEINISYRCINAFDDTKQTLYGFTPLNGNWIVHNLKANSNGVIFENASIMLLPMDDKALEYFFPTSKGFIARISFKFNSDDIYSKANKDIAVEYSFYKSNDPLETKEIKNLNSLFNKIVTLKDVNKLQNEILSLHNQTHLLLGKSNKSGNLVNAGGSTKYCIRDVLNQ